MKKLMQLLGNLFAAFYLIFPLGLIIILFIFMPLMFPNDVSAIRTSGFAGPNTTVELIFLAGLIIGISLFVPVLRKIYDVFPWLFSFIKIFFITFIILNIGISLLNYGYEIDEPTRHTLFYVLMIISVIVGRLLMSFYFWKYPVRIGKKGARADEE